MKTLTFALLAAVVVACKSGSDATSANPPVVSGANIAACGTSTTPFSVVPVPLADLLGWVPLGNLAPPGHLLPTDHQYLYINSPENPATVRPVSVVSPGEITITRAHRTHYSNSDTYDYDIEFSPCRELHANFGHVTTIVAPLLAKLGPFDQQCGSYTLGTGVVFTNCFTSTLDVKVHAGESIGTTGGQGTSFALDFGLRDSRITPLTFANPSHWPSNADGNDIFHVVPASDYFAEPARLAVRATLGTFNGSAHRTMEPVGGRIAYDERGTAQGVWMNASQPTYPEGPHLAVVLDPVDPARVVISMGTSQPGFPAGLYSVAPLPTGFVNRHPSQITADASIYCYEFPQSLGVLLVRLDDGNTLRVEGRAGTTTCAQQQPWTFGANAFVYKR